jgi:hypothetical protein
MFLDSWALTPAVVYWEHEFLAFKGRLLLA